MVPQTALSRKDTPLERTQICGSKYRELHVVLPLKKRTSLIKTEFFGRKGVLNRGGGGHGGYCTPIGLPTVDAAKGVAGLCAS